MREWVEYYNTEPFFADRLEAQIAQLIAIIVNFMGGKASAQDFSISKAQQKSKIQKKQEFEKAMRAMIKKGKNEKCQI